MTSHMISHSSSFLNRGVVVSAVCVYPANNSKNDATDAGGNNGGVFDIFRTPLINPLTSVRSSSGYVEVGINSTPCSGFCGQSS